MSDSEPQTRARMPLAHLLSILGNSAFAEVRNLRLAAVAEYKICIHSFRHMFALLYQKTPGFIGCISPYLLLLFLFCFLFSNKHICFTLKLEGMTHQCSTTR